MALSAAFSDKVATFFLFSAWLGWEGGEVEKDFLLPPTAEGAQTSFLAFCGNCVCPMPRKIGELYNRDRLWQGFRGCHPLVGDSQSDIAIPTGSLEIRFRSPDTGRRGGCRGGRELARFTEFKPHHLEVSRKDSTSTSGEAPPSSIGLLLASKLQCSCP